MTQKVNATAAKEISRKNKRRFNFENRVAKISDNFIRDKDIHYKDRLTSLQTSLTTLHQGTNPIFLRRLRDLEEERDLELVRLRLYEEYRVSRSGIEFQEDIEKAKDDHEKLVKLCKERLYFSIEQKMKRLQEERLLMDVANVHSYSMDYSRPLIYQKNTRSQTASGTNNGWDSSSNEFARKSGNDSATDTGTERRSLRRKAANRNGNRSNAELDGTDYYSGSNLNGDIRDESDFRTSGNTTAGGGKRKNQKAGSATPSGYKSDINSDTDFLQGISDYADLQALLFGEKEEKANETQSKKKHRINPRYSTKSAPPLQSLNQDEVTTDIALIRDLTGQPPAPFKIRNPVE